MSQLRILLVALSLLTIATSGAMGAQAPSVLPSVLPAILPAVLPIVIEDEFVGPLQHGVDLSPLGDPETGRLLDETLRASSIDDPARRARIEAQFVQSFVRMKAYVRNHGSQYRRARRLHDWLHRNEFKQYVALADGLDSILDRGEYNCVSATLFFGIMGRGLGLDLRVVETPHHIYLRLQEGGRIVDIETTSPTGYDFTGDLERFRRFTWAFQSAAENDAEAEDTYWRFERAPVTPTASVSLEQATAFLWHNTGDKALAGGNAVEAARCFEEEYLAYPQMAIRVQGFGASLARAFQSDYEAGRFDDAYRIAAIEMHVFPLKTSARDRMLAVASKRIDMACEAGKAALAEQLLRGTFSFLAVDSDQMLLVRETAAHIAAAAVRNGDWARAHRMAELYESAQPDSVEARRLTAWIEGREAGLDQEPLCPVPARGGMARWEAIAQ